MPTQATEPVVTPESQANPLTTATAPEADPAEVTEPVEAAPEPIKEPVKEAEPVQEAEPVKESKPQEEPAEETKAEDVKETPERVVPDSAEYVLPEGAPEDLALWAKNNDMTQEQLTNTLKQFGGYLEAGKQAEQVHFQELGKAHVEAWGSNADTNLSLVRRALKQNDPTGQMAEVLNATGYGNHPAVLDFFLSIGNSMKEGGFLKSSRTIPKGQKSAAQTMFGDKHPSVN